MTGCLQLNFVLMPPGDFLGPDPNGLTPKSEFPFWGHCARTEGKRCAKCQLTGSAGTLDRRGRRGQRLSGYDIY